MALEIEKIAFTVILHAGNAKSEAYKALAEAKQGRFENIEMYLKNAKRELNEVHGVQTELLTAEANGDHLMTAMSEINLVEELIDCVKEIHRLNSMMRQQD